MSITSRKRRYSFGPAILDHETSFRVWAPTAREVFLNIDGTKVKMERDGEEFWEVSLSGNRTGSLYGFILDGEGPFPDPAGRFMPSGINGLSQFIDTDNFRSLDSDWKGIDLKDMVIYECHVGTLSPSGNYSGISHIADHLIDLGINTVEIMPVAQFFGTRNWGYDGVYIYSPASCYGSPENLWNTVSYLHSRGIAVILDVVYNHSGFIGNYLDRFGPFHSNWHRTPWGNCFNLDGPYSDSVRRFILENVRFWIEDYGFDGLRLDAVHGIIDTSPRHILADIGSIFSDLTEKLGRRIVAVAETDQNDLKITEKHDKCGYGLNAQWNDDFHHSLHTLFTGENRSYYMDYGAPEDLLRTLKHGFDYNGRWSPHLKKTRGTNFGEADRSRLVVCSQNHDQIGNRAFGERLITLAGKEAAKQAAALTLLSPFTPMLFQGEEYGETNPFLFFVDTNDRDIAMSILDGRRKEFESFGWQQNIPDPNDPETFLSSKIGWEKQKSSDGQESLDLYRGLIGLRKRYVSGRTSDYAVSERTKPIMVSYRTGLKLAASFLEENIPFPDHVREILYDLPSTMDGSCLISSGEGVFMKKGVLVYL